MITLDSAKDFLRVDGGAEDTLIQAMVDASDSYLAGAVSGYASLYNADATFAKTADMVRYAYIAEAFRNRDAANDGRPNDRHFSYMFFSQVTQLQNWTVSGP